MSGDVCLLDGAFLNDFWVIMRRLLGGFVGGLEHKTKKRTLIAAGCDA